MAKPRLPQNKWRRSPSMRREWIEMDVLMLVKPSIRMSPSMRREWIEIHHIFRDHSVQTSPSMRREWIEMV